MMAGMPTTQPSPDDIGTGAQGRQTRDALLHELSELTLPMMWSLRQEAVRAFEPLGFTPVKALVLGMITTGTRSPKQLAELLDTPPPMMSNLLADLQTRGLVQRRPDPDDRRRVVVEPTPDGHAMTERFAQAWLEAGRAKTQALSDDDLRHLVRIYRALVGST